MCCEDCQPGGEEREEVYPEEHQEGLGFLHLLQSGREHTSRPCKERDPKLSFQSLPRSGLGKLLLSVGGHRNGWDGLRYPVSLRPC